MLSRPLTLPASSVTTLPRPQALWMTTPSSSALAISSLVAGISWRFSRQMRVTFFAPRRLAVRATSMATLPPPHTSTFWPMVFCR